MFEQLIKDIKAEQRKIEESLAKGTAKDYAQYKGLSGEWCGMDRCINIINNILKESERDE